MLRSTILLVLLASVTGCSRQDIGRVALCGTVLYDGELVSCGSIAIRPAPDSTGPAAGTDIRDGKYEIPVEAGPGTGSYLARITIVKQDAANSPNFAGKGGGVTSLEVPVEIEKDTETRDFSVPRRKKR